MTLALSLLHPTTTMKTPSSWMIPFHNPLDPHLIHQHQYYPPQANLQTLQSTPPLLLSLPPQPLRTLYHLLRPIERNVDQPKKNPQLRQRSIPSLTLPLYPPLRYSRLQTSHLRRIVDPKKSSTHRSPPLSWTELPPKSWALSISISSTTFPPLQGKIQLV